MGLFTKGSNLKKSINPSEEVSLGKPKYTRELAVVLKKTKINRKATREHLYRIPRKIASAKSVAKSAVQPGTRYRAFVKETKQKGTARFRVLVVKESKEQLLGWRVYVSR